MAGEIEGGLTPVAGAATPPIIAPGYTFSTVTDKIASIVLTRKTSIGWWLGFLLAFAIVNVLSLPLIILTLGLFLLVTNALMLLLTSKLADTFGLEFHVDGFWTAVFGALVISIASMIVESLLPDQG